MTLADNSPMPFGKHKGTDMEDVPAAYLIYLWDENKTKYESKQLNTDMMNVMDYINENMDVLAVEIKRKTHG